MISVLFCSTSFDSVRQRRVTQESIKFWFTLLPSFTHQGCTEMQWQKLNMAFLHSAWRRFVFITQTYLHFCLSNLFRYLKFLNWTQNRSSETSSVCYVEDNLQNAEGNCNQSSTLRLILQWVLNSRILTIHRHSLPCFVSCHLQKKIERNKTSKKNCLSPFIRYRKLFCFGTASICHSQSLFFSQVFWELFISCQSVEEKTVSSVSYAPLTVPLSYTAQGKEKQNPWHHAEMPHYIVCPG